MRKLKTLLLSAALLATAGCAWAQPTVTNNDVTSISTDKYYYLWNNGRSCYMNISYTFTTGAKSDVLLSNSISADNWVKYIIRFEADGENYRVKFFDDSYLTTANSSANVQTSDNVADAISVSATYDATNKWALKNLTNNLYFNGNAATFCYWGTSQDTNTGKYFIREVNVTAEEFAAAQADAQPQEYFSTSYAEAKWFNMTIRNNSNFVAYSTTEPYNCRIDATEAQRASDAFQWALIGNSTDGVQVVNKATGAAYALTKDGGNAVLREGAQKWVINDNGDGFVLNIEGSSAYINDVDGKFQFWDSQYARTDAGSTMHFLPAPSIPIVDVTYRVLYNDNEVASATIAAESGSTIPAIPSELQRDYLTLSYDNTIIATAGLTVDVNATWSGPALSTSVETANWQNLAIRGNWYVTSDNVDTDGALKTVNANALGLVEDAYQWALVGDPYHIQLFNKAQTNNFGYSDAAKVNQGIPGFQEETSYWTLKPSTNGNVPTGSFVLNVYGTNLYINQFGGEGGSLKFWNSGSNIGDAGSAFTIFDVPTNFAEYVTSEIAPYFEASGKYFVLNDAAKTASGYDEAYKTNCSYADYKNMKDKLPTILSNLSNFVLPETGYYRLKNNNYNTYMGLKATTVYGNYTADADVNGAPTIVKLTKNENSEYSIAIQGKYLQALTNSTNVPTAAEAAFFKPGIQTPGQVSFSVEGEGYTYTHCAGSGAVVGWVLNAAASQWTLEDAASIDVSVSAAGYATLNVPFAVSIPEGMKAYTGKVNGNYLVLSEVSGTIPANTAVVLEAADGNYRFGITADVAAIADNDLQGTLTEAKPEGALTLQVIDEAIGFYTFDGKAIGANKAYITLPAGVKALTFDFGGADGVGQLTDKVAATAIYNLAGQRVQQAQHGIYLVGGKKVIVK